MIKINEFTNKLYCGDNLKVMRKYIKNESVDLCYIDPPFNSNRNYNQKNQNDKSNKNNQNINKLLAFKDKWPWSKDSQKAFEEIIENKRLFYTNQTIELIEGLKNVLGKGQILAYLVCMTQRFQEIHRVLKDTGSFYLHCDPTMSHYLKLLLDSIFVARGGEFRNEIVWCYKRWTNSSDDFQKMHDLVFRYSKTKRTVFNKIFDCLGKIPKHFQKGYITNTVIQNGKRITQLLVYDVKKSLNKIKEKNYDKLIFRENKKQIVLPDWWEIPILNSQAKERLGYPTQKPEALLERIIKASSNEGDIVLDAFCGCGTTLISSEKLKRKWIGIDDSPLAIKSTKQRLKHLKGVFLFYNL